MVSRTQTYKASKYQKKLKLGFIFSSIFRAATSLVKGGVKYIRREAIKIGLNTVNDIIEEKNAKQFLVNRIKLSMKNITKDAKEYIAEQPTVQKLIT